MTTLTAEKLGDIIGVIARAKSALYDDGVADDHQFLGVVDMNLKLAISQLETLRDEIAIPKVSVRLCDFCGYTFVGCRCRR